MQMEKLSVDQDQDQAKSNTWPELKAPASHVEVACERITLNLESLLYDVLLIIIII